MLQGCSKRIRNNVSAITRRWQSPAIASYVINKRAGVAAELLSLNTPTNIH